MISILYYLLLSLVFPPALRHASAPRSASYTPLLGVFLIPHFRRSASLLRTHSPHARKTNVKTNKFISTYKSNNYMLLYLMETNIYEYIYMCITYTYILIFLNSPPNTAPAGTFYSENNYVPTVLPSGTIACEFLPGVCRPLPGGAYLGPGLRYHKYH